MTNDAEDSVRSKRQIKRVLIFFAVLEFIAMALAMFHVVKK